MDVKRIERAAPRAAATQACKSRASVRSTADLTSQSGKKAVAVAFGNGTVDLLHQLVVVHLSAFPVARQRADDGGAQAPEFDHIGGHAHLALQQYRLEP